MTTDWTAFSWQVWLLGLAATATLMTLAWAVSVARRDAGVADPTWPFLFTAAAGVYASQAPNVGPRTWLVLALVGVWSVRLGGYLLWRNLKDDEEDRRYRKMRESTGEGFWWKSLPKIFWLQAALAWFISLPLLGGVDPAPPLGWIDAIGVALWFVGMVFEAGGDFQLARFKADPENEGEVLDEGLWRYTRHPNYFGDFCIWWGFYALAVAAGAWWSLPGPLLMSFLLLKVSGVALLEDDIEDRRSEYGEYKRRTNAFFPGPPSEA